MISAACLPKITIALSGEIDIATSPAVRQALMAAISAGAASLTVNMAGVRFIDASGIGVLIAAANRARDAGGTLSLQDPSRQVRRIVGILHLGGRLPTGELRLAGDAAAVAVLAGRVGPPAP